MLRTGPLTLFDMQENPHLFFKAHRLLAEIMCAGFGIRYTVLFNLFAGSIIGLGTEEQAKQILSPIQTKGELGCFALTERSAGVLSGLIVETTAAWDLNKQKFVLQTPNEDACKNWISQGLAAEWAVVVACLITPDGKNHGPHAFYLRIRDFGTGELVRGVTATDMGPKTVCNDLDNAALSFDGVEIGLENLLQRYSTIEPATGKYVQKTKEKMRIEVIGQRLLTGRLAIAQMSCIGVRNLFDSVEKYANNKQVHPAPGVSYPLAQVPQLAEALRDGRRGLTRMIQYSNAVETDLCACLRRNVVPERRLVEEIAVAKIKALEVAIEAGHKLEQEVGSFALMGGSGFEHKDVLLCCKFAEGDSRILMQKMTRDSLKWVSEIGWGERLVGHLLFGREQSRTRMWKALSLANQLQSKVKASGDPIGSWNQLFKEVYSYADFLCERYVSARVGSNTGPDGVAGPQAKL